MGDQLAVTIKKGFSTEPDTAKALEQIASQIFQPNASITTLFSSSYFDTQILEAGIQRLFVGPVLGCSTAGEINQSGYSRHSISGFSIASDLLKVQLFPIFPIGELDSSSIEHIITTIRQALQQPPFNSMHHFGILIIDGLSIMEEQLTALLGNSFPDISIIGGSSGDDLRLEKSFVYTNKKFRNNSATFCLFSTHLPFRTIKSQHFSSTDKRIVITRADPEKRIIYEINGFSAAPEYARIIGVSKEHLCPDIFSRYPLLLNIGGEIHVRSIQKVNTDQSFTMFCTIDEGLVLRIGKSGDLVGELEKSFNQAEQEIGPIQLTIGFDCIHRRLESSTMGLDSSLNKIWKKYNVIGFCTYGEQINAVHVNQTFAGIAIGETYGQ